MVWSYRKGDVVRVAHRTSPHFGVLRVPIRSSLTWLAKVGDEA